ncbi:EAL domain-containing protein [Rheinheimera mesophila]|uniref:EAL domain-containing protein n=1 Tax=Rheinheimera mesophila TaxID=1547515 RepID=A0A3P3QRI6_9GAMM|nr:EAL domain-containing protein [Rheinheimera mesophila]RRJ23832.1 EAL domain-containing protein [Rheinheimera mesophila]
MLLRCLKFCLAFWLVCCSGAVQAYLQVQPMVHSRQSQHLAIELFTQDSSGLLWWSTSTQLHRFDGHEHQSFNLPEQLQTQALVQLLTLNQQQLWLASLDQLWLFEQNTGQFRQIWQSKQPIKALFLSNSFAPLILTEQEIWQWPVQSPEARLLWRSSSTAAAWVQGVSDGHSLWLWSKDSRLSRYDLSNQRWQQYPLALPPHTDLAVGPDQQLWLLAQNKQLYQLKGQELLEIAPPADFYASSLEVDPLGQVWLLSDQRLYLYQPDTQSWQIQPLAQAWTELFADRHQNIWLADASGTLALAQSSAVAMQSAEPTQFWDNKNQLWHLEQQRLTLQSAASGQSLSLTFPFAPDQVKKLWQLQQHYFVWASDKIWRYDASTASWLAQEPQPVLDLALAEEQFWYLTEQGLWQWDHNSGATLLNNQISWTLVRYHSGQLWLSGAAGLYSYELAEQQLRSYQFSHCHTPPCADARQIIDLQPEATGLWLLSPDQLYFYQVHYDNNKLKLALQKQWQVPWQQQSMLKREQQLWLWSRQQLSLLDLDTNALLQWQLNQGEYLQPFQPQVVQQQLLLNSSMHHYRLPVQQHKRSAVTNPLRLELIAENGQHLTRKEHQLYIDSWGPELQFRLSHYPAAGQQWNYFRYSLDKAPAQVLTYPQRHFSLQLGDSGSYQLTIEASRDGLNWQQAGDYQLQFNRYWWIQQSWLWLILFLSVAMLAFLLWRYRVHQQRLHQQLEQQLMISSLFDNTQDAVWLGDEQLRIEKVNQAFCHITGFDAKQMQGQTLQLYTAQGHQTELLKTIVQQLQQFNFWRGEVWSKKANGDSFALSLAITLLSGKEMQEPKLYLAIFSDVTNRKLNERELRKLSTRDPLTQLPNRALFLEHLDRAFYSCSSRFPHFAVLLVDLDRFAKINDSLGHDSGNQLLKMVAERLQKQLPAGYILAKLGVDEFAILVPSHFSVEQFDLLLNRLSLQLLLQIRQPIALGDLEITLTASIGIAVYPDDGRSSDILMRSADTALHHAKQMGRNNAQFFNDKMLQRTPEYLALESDLWRGISQGEFKVVYQPKYNVGSNTIVGYEALCRWHNPVRGIVSPLMFIPIAEENGVIIQLDRLVFSQVCAQIQQWQHQGRMRGRVAVNLSVQQLQQPDLLDFLRQELEHYQLDAALLELEITETAMMRDADHCLEVMHQLKAMGFTLALDDFGTGYSSLGYLKRFPIDTLKIDRAFIKDMDTSEQDRNITSTIIRLAGYLKIAVVAEGVETEMQAYLLHVMGCQVVQGYLFSPPVQPEQIAALLDKEPKTEN